MCLTLNKESKLRVATRDIKVYKMMMIRSDGKEITPFNDYELKQTNITELQIKPSIHYSIDLGFHSYAKLSDANAQAKCWDADNYDHYVVRCIIPKGAKYWDGTSNNIANYNGKLKSYVSNKLNRL